MTADSGRFVQALIVSSGEPSAALEAARELAAEAVCTAPGARPCGVCRACRKAKAGIHPDIITVRRQTDDKGRLRREITVKHTRLWRGAGAGCAFLRALSPRIFRG